MPGADRFLDTNVLFYLLSGDETRADRAACTIVPITEATHDLGLQLAQRHRLSTWDAMIVASARLAGCKTVLTEDMQDGQSLAGLRVRNPFR